MIEALIEVAKGQWSKQRSNPLQRFEIQIDSLDIRDLLTQVSSDQISYYWKDRDSNYESIGLGVSHAIQGDDLQKFPSELDRIQALVSGQGPRYRYYGGNRFNDKQHNDSTWGPIYSYRYTLPYLEWSKDDSGTYVAVYVNCDECRSFEDVKQRIEELFLYYATFKPSTNSQSDIIDIDRGNEQPLKSVISKAIHDMKNSASLKKVVLSSKHVCRFSSSPQPLELIHDYLEPQKNVFQFMFKLANNHFFFGSSPESLYSIRDGELRSEAIAGTKPVGYSEEAFLKSEKDVIEHRYVHDMISNCFEHLCDTRVEQHQPTVLKLERLQHLHQQYKGLLKEGIKASDCFSFLHPTPAVVGLSKDESMQWINEHEQHIDRGLFAGVVGYVGDHNSQSTVAIRSLLLAGNELHAFAGAGVVAQSSVDDEWDEIQLKLNSILNRCLATKHEVVPG